MKFKIVSYSIIWLVMLFVACWNYHILHDYTEFIKGAACGIFVSLFMYVAIAIGEEPTHPRV